MRIDRIDHEAFADLAAWWDSIFMDPRAAGEEEEEEDGFRDGGVDENGKMCEDEDIDVTE